MNTNFKCVFFSITCNERPVFFFFFFTFILHWDPSPCPRLLSHWGSKLFQDKKNEDILDRWLALISSLWLHQLQGFELEYLVLFYGSPYATNMLNSMRNIMKGGSKWKLVNATINIWLSMLYHTNYSISLFYVMSIVCLSSNAVTSAIVGQLSCSRICPS